MKGSLYVCVHMCMHMSLEKYKWYIYIVFLAPNILGTVAFVKLLTNFVHL